jgi:hypothetical protein
VKIYDKKKFAFGVMYFLLGLGLLILGFLKGFDAEKIILTILMFLIGISEMYLSTNREAVKQEKFEETEERNQLIKLTSKSRAFDLTQRTNFVLVVLFLIIGGQSGDQRFIAMGVAVAISFSVSIFSELFSRIYYERHM